MAWSLWTIRLALILAHSSCQWDTQCNIRKCCPPRMPSGRQAHKLEPCFCVSAQIPSCPPLMLCIPFDVQVRTVAAFGMEQFTVDKYDKALEFPERVRLRHIV